MKPIILFTSVLFAIFFSGNATAQKHSKSEDIKVWGNCGMCQKTIEAAALNGGATKASWSEESKVLSVTYNDKKSDSKKIQEAVAASGYDTQDVTAPTEVYNKLHSCCQYDRKAVAQVAGTNTKVCCDKENCDHKNDCTKGGKCEKDKSSCKNMTDCKEKDCCKN